MSNTFINPTVVAKEACIQLENELVVARNVHRAYEEEFKKKHNGYKQGSSVTIKAPIYFRVKDGATLDAVDILEQDITLTVNLRKHVAWAVTSQEMTLNIDKFSERYIKPAMQALANYIDYTVLGLYKDVPNQIGTPGTTPSNFYTFAQAQAKLTEHACPEDNRSCVISPAAQAKLADHLKGLFHQPVVGTAVKKGMITENLAGFKMFTSNNVNTHTNGTWPDGTVYVDDTVSEGDHGFNIDQNAAGSAYTLKDGDYFTVAAVNAVNPISGQSTGSSRGFTVDGDQIFADAGQGDMNCDLNCIPGTDPWLLYSESASETYLPYQNVDALPLENALITVAGSTGQQYPVNLAFHKHALALVMVPLAMPVSAAWKAQESYKGYTIRVIRDYDVTNDQEYIRFDVLFGVKAINPMLACRIAG